MAASRASDMKADEAEKRSSAAAAKGHASKGKKAKATTAKADAQPSSRDRMFAGGK